MKKVWLTRGLYVGVSIAALAVPAAVQAQEAADQGGLGDIIVTAQRREERLQDVPVAVSAISAEAMSSKGVQNTLDLVQVVPSLVMTSQAGATQVRIRGVGTSNFGPGVENPVAIYVDGVYIASTSGAFFNLANIERVETLKGPQGTLFGRNATGGLVQVITREPGDTLKGFLRAGYGNYQTATVDGYVSGPLSNSMSADLAVHYANSGKGWGHNVHTGGDVNKISDDLIIRSKIKMQVTENFKLVLAGDYSYLDGNRGVTLQEVPGTIGTYDRIYYPASALPVNHGGWYDNDSFTDPHLKIKSGGGSLTASVNAGDTEFKSITAYRSTRMPTDFALTRVPFDALMIDIVDKWDQFSQELQVNGKSGPLKYTAGMYYFTSVDKYDPFHLPFGTAFSPIAFAGSLNAVQQFNSRLKTNSYAAYAQMTYEVMPDTNITLGGRYTNESKDVSGTQSLVVTYPAPVGTVVFVPVGTPYYTGGGSPHLHANNFSYRISIDHKFSNDIMGYVSYNTAFKSGGYNLNTPANPAYKPEKIKAIEAGLKTELFDRHLRLNLSAYHYDYTDMQVNNFIATSTYIVNGGKSKIDGFELEAEAKVAEGLTISAGVGYANGRFTDFPNAGYNYKPDGTTCAPGTTTGNAATPCLINAAGNKLQNTPEFTGNIGFAYEHTFNNIVFGMSSNVFHTSKVYGTFDNDPRGIQPGYELVNGSFYLEPANTGLRMTVWGKNLFGVKYAANRYISSQQTVIQAGAPRTYGVTIEKKF